MNDGNISDQLGGGYYVETSDCDEEIDICLSKRAHVPGENVRFNPIMCNLTRRIFSRLADSSLENESC